VCLSAYLGLFVVIFGTACHFPSAAAGRWCFAILGDSLLAARAYVRVAALLLLHASRTALLEFGGRRFTG